MANLSPTTDELLDIMHELSLTHGKSRHTVSRELLIKLALTALQVDNLKIGPQGDAMLRSFVFEWANVSVLNEACPGEAQEKRERCTSGSSSCSVGSRRGRSQSRRQEQSSA